MTLATTTIFIPIKDSHAKLKAITDITTEQFLNNESLLIFVPSLQAAQYVDALLWRLPQESFLPHVIADAYTAEKFIITTKPVNWNKASVLLNLCPNPCPIFNEFIKIYDLWDESDSAKAALSEKRKIYYETK